jgi:hypothetical protein
MAASQSASAAGLMLLKEVTKRPTDYGLDHRHAFLKDILAFTIRYPRCVRDSESSAGRKIKRCLERSRHAESDAAHIHRRIRRQLRQVKESLAWVDLDLRLNVTSCFWNVGRYSRLARHLCVLAALCRYRRRHFSKAPFKPVNAVATRVARLTQLKECSWKAVQDYLSRCGLDWQVRMATHLGDTVELGNAAEGGTTKVVRCDQDGNPWVVKYSPESLMNPVMASIFARLCGCPGAEVCPSFLDYDPHRKQPCSVQPYIREKQVRRLDRRNKSDLIRLIGGSRRRGSQVLCQAVSQWILEDIDGNQVIIDGFANLVFVDHDRSFFIDDHRVTTGFQGAWEARKKTGISAVPADLINATARIPGVLEDLAAFVSRVEAIPALVYEGLVRNASFREDQLCGLYYLDTMSCRALGSIRAMEQWITHLLARKRTIRAVLAGRLREVLGGAQRQL